MMDNIVEICGACEMASNTYLCKGCDKVHCSECLEDAIRRCKLCKEKGKNKSTQDENNA